MSLFTDILAGALGVGGLIGGIWEGNQNRNAVQTANTTSQQNYNAQLSQQNQWFDELLSRNDERYKDSLMMYSDLMGLMQAGDQYQQMWDVERWGSYQDQLARLWDMAYSDTAFNRAVYGEQQGYREFLDQYNMALSDMLQGRAAGQQGLINQISAQNYQNQLGQYNTSRDYFQSIMENPTQHPQFREIAEEVNRTYGTQREGLVGSLARQGATGGVAASQLGALGQTRAKSLSDIITDITTGAAAQLAGLSAPQQEMPGFVQVGVPTGVSSGGTQGTSSATGAVAGAGSAQPGTSGGTFNAIPYPSGGTISMPQLPNAPDIGVPTYSSGGYSGLGQIVAALLNRQ